MRGRELQAYIRRQIKRRLGSKSWTWLAREAGVRRTTLVSQMSRSKISVDVLVGVADALGVVPGDLLPPPPGPQPPKPGADAMVRISRYLQVLAQELEEDL